MGSKQSENAQLDAALASIEKQFGVGSVMRMDADPEQVPAIGSGVLPLDLALGVGGIPRGRVVEAYGPESSGKTTISLMFAAQAQREGGTVAFIDAEHALDPAWAAKLGVDISELLVSQPDNGEQALQIVETLVASGVVDLVIVDSVAALTPKAEIDGEMGDSHVGLQARLMSQGLRKLSGVVKRTGTTVFFTNQLREKIGVQFGSPETTPGGRALKFYSSVRMDVRRIETLKENNEPFGIKIRVKVVKNKVAPPFKKSEFNLYYTDGICRAAAAIDLGVEHGVITKSGAWYSFNGQQLGQGHENSRKFLRAPENADVFTHVERQVREKLGIPLPSDVDAPAGVEDVTDGDEPLGVDPSDVDDLVGATN